MLRYCIIGEIVDWSHIAPSLGYRLIGFSNVSRVMSAELLTNIFVYE